MRALYTLLLAICVTYAYAQETFPVNDVKDVRDKAYAFTNATIHTDHQNVISNGTLLIRDGKIENVGSGLAVPSGYTKVDLGGKHIYPGLVDPYTTYGIPKPKEERGGGHRVGPQKDGAYNANDAIRSYYRAAEEFKHDAKASKTMRNLGFSAALALKKDGLARGTSTFVTFGDDTENNLMLKPAVAAHYSFDKGTSTQTYPGVSLGFIAVLRQTYMDASWYSKLNPKPFTDNALDGWLASQSLPQIFETSGWLSALRADKVGDEFGVQYIIVGGGDEYQRLDQIKATGASMIIPINFPKAYDVDDPFEAQKVSLEDMKHWELAPTNLAALEKAGVNFAVTTDGLKDKKAFWKNIRSAVEHGLSKEAAIKSMTSSPAQMLRMQNQVGALRSGYVANFIITSGDLFEKDTKVQQNWIQGKKYVVEDPDENDYAGNYELNVGSAYALKVTGEPGKHKAKIEINDTTSVDVKLKIEENSVSMSFNPDKDTYSSDFRLSGWIDGPGQAWKGRGNTPDGAWIDWSAEFSGKEEKEEGEDKKADDPSAPELGKVIYPFAAYGAESLPQQQTILIKNITVWTNEEDGILENTDVLLKDGKISKIGQNLKSSDAVEIDGTGKHLTAGIIDEHSHIGTSAVNDYATNSSMVRIGDVLNSEQINIYRALAGGVTAIQILHGSANPIGGQSALIKLRWGVAPEELKIKGADEYIKFALGENVKRFGGNARYPDTRMGTEQVFRDAFTAARDYQKKWDAYNKLPSKSKATALAPRRDLTMDAMSEILNKERFISCHSYVQSEINMLMKVAEDFDFRVNTFTHILEGYKVADKMAAHGVGGSTFADWWAYKWEVRYAIPYNAALMHREGVVTAINSDNAEMMRRLNQEAAKSVKYGDIPEEDALKFVTLNPAKLLHLDDRMGSIKKGKDADVVVWSDHPLSIYAKVEKTIVDGTIYFDTDRDQELRDYIASERARLIAKMRGDKKNGKSTQKAKPKMNVNFHCDDLFELN